MTLPTTFMIDAPGEPRAPPSCVASNGWQRFSWQQPLRCSSRRGRSSMSIPPSASSRRLRKPPPSAAWPTGMRWWRCSSGPGIADPAHRDHPEQPAPHRRHARRIHRKEFSGGRSGRGKVAPDRFRRLRCRLAARSQAQRDLARFALRLLPEAFSATETSVLMKFITAASPRNCCRSISRRWPPARSAASCRRASMKACSTISCA